MPSRRSLRSLNTILVLLEVAFGIIICAAAGMPPIVERFSEQSLAFVILYSLGLHLKISQTQPPVRASLQIFLAFFYVYVIIMEEAYSAKLVSFLTVERIPKGINTFEDLYHSKLPILGISCFYYDSLRDTGSYYGSKLLRQYKKLPSFENIYEQLLAGQGVYMSSTNNIIYVISLFSKNGFPTLRRMKDCHSPFHSTLGVQTHSPLKKHMDPKVLSVVAAGLTEHWMRESLLTARKERWEASNHTEDDTVEETKSGVSFSMEHLQGVFIMICAGYCLSLIVFTAEYSWDRTT